MPNQPFALLRTPLCDLLGCDVPILLAGMGGVARSELAGAIANAGGFATLGMVRENPDLIAAEVASLRRVTTRPFAINLIPAATEPGLLSAQIDRCLDLGIRVFSFFWDVDPKAISRVKAEGCLVLHQVGTLESAREAERAGADVIIAQGCEAGGHVHGRMATLPFAATLLDEISVPVVLSGGVSTGRGLAAALAMGAAGVQCGTAFLATTESYAHDHHKRRLIEAEGDETVLTDAFVLNWPAGAAVRVLRSRMTDALGAKLLGHDPAALPREVIALDEGRGILRYSTDSPLRSTTGDLEDMPLYSGQGAGSIGAIVPAGERLREMCDEALELLSAATRQSVRRAGMT